jgi:HEAT repeat protein
MSRRDKRWIVAGSVAVLAGLGWLGLRDRGVGWRHPLGSGQAKDDGFQGFSSRPFAAAGAGLGSPRPPETPEMIAQQVDGAMNRWRNAILVKDAPSVVALDLMFRGTPDRYTAALAKSAESDDNERVRAFSTRVLGKLKNAAEAPLYQRLLTDKSPFVRQNAAWALGELGSAAAPAFAQLQRAGARDPATDVRAAANVALNKL